MANSNDSTGRSTSELQEDLFYPDMEREPGDRNIQGLGFDIHPVVFPAALLIIGVFVAATLILGEQAASVYSGIRGFFEGNFGWFFLLSVNLFIVVLAYFALSKYGKITLGGVEAEKEFSDFSWMAMLFSAGMGIGLMFYSVSEPLYYFSNVPGFFDAEAGSGGAGIAAMTQTFFHWRFHPWAIYGLVGLGLAFFSFNRGLPLTFRSIFWPLLGERIYGWPGHLIDLVAVFATLFGLATSLGLGVAQINTGLSYILGGSMLGVLSVPNNTGMQIALIAVITLIATASVAAGLEGGIRRLSTVNVFLMFVLLTFVLAAGATMSIFGAWVQGLGNYFSDFLSLAFFTGTLGDGASTVNAWTVFYWAWWIAWSPFVGMFVARISKGRTVREFVFGTMKAARSPSVKPPQLTTGPTGAACVVPRTWSASNCGTHSRTAGRLSPWAWAATGTPDSVSSTAVSGFLSRSVTIKSRSNPASRTASAAVEAATTTSTSGSSSRSSSASSVGAAPQTATVAPAQFSRSRSNGFTRSASASLARSSPVRSKPKSSRIRP